MRKLQAAALLSVLTATLGLSACGSNDEGDTLNDTNATQIGAALAAQLGSTPASFTATGVSNGTVGGGFFGARAMATARWAQGALPNLTFQAPCPSVDDLTDADGDGVLDDATFTFTQADCTSGAFYTTGAIHLVDPSSVAVGYSGTFLNFLVHFTGSGNDFAQIKLNGSHAVLGTPSSGTLDENITTTVDASDNGQTLHGSLSNNWSIQFDVAQGDAIEMDAPLPDGDFDAQGSFVYNVNGQRFSLSIRTESALVYNSTCAGAPNPFDSGEVRAHLGGPNGNVYVKITYNGCGVEPTVELFGRNS
ncbi:MAG: hypothetical protein ABI836_06675 [Gemmatimonadota bacterium]